ncbi:hypothetical protein [Georgenia sp. Z1491]|uniref:hypothetical protein n=1 Tax=Georgenia sp. Z1491 TaxID=3416707 RepID=UPI003CEA0931
MRHHPRSARRRGAAIGALTLGFGVLATGSAAADDPSSAADAIVIDVGEGFAPVVTVQLFDAVIVPGGDIERTFRVRNDGPTAATMTVDIVDVTQMGELDEFFDDVTINDHPVTSLLGVDTALVEAPIERGEIVDVPLELHFPVEATSGNRSEVGARGASFGVRVTMTGDTPEVPTTEPPGETPTSPPERPVSTPATSGVAGGGVSGGGTAAGGLPVAGPRAAGPVALPQTGPDILTTLMIAAALAGGGLAARAARQRFGAGGTGASS